MIFSTKATPRRLSAVAALTAFLGLGLLASCGGGSSQSDPFVPERLLVFGDDDSTLRPDGRKYSVNGLNTAGAIDCNLQPIWVQSVAASYGFVFAECNPGAVATPQALMRASVGAKVADVAAQVEAQAAAGGYRDKDLATVLAGANDIFELYQQSPVTSEAALLAEAGARGRQLAQVVNRLIQLGAKVVVSDLPDLGLTPYALAQNAIEAGRAGLLTRLTTAFNEQLGVTVLLDGRFVGLVQAQLRFQAAVRSPVSFGLIDTTQPICLVALPDCTTATLRTDAVNSQYLWADDKRLAGGGHDQLAVLAVDRARNNPF